ncbi:hypothetical protein Sjap_016593 [Stephania japonica]|uniref:Reverse transcriptase zinc-binding domain-containing protein n=1 Tax=Stephania japonica TaxID=461633 RepID=A0AAP0IMY2_9MAGN
MLEFSFIWTADDGTGPSSGNCEAYKTIWKSYASMKCRVLCWMVWLDKVNVADILQKRCPLIYLQPSWRALCKADEESIDHVFLHCRFSLCLWHAMATELGSGLDDDVSHAMAARKGILWRTGMLMILWSLWEERNGRIFRSKDRNWEEVWAAAKRYAANVLSNTKEIKAWSWTDLKGNWSRLLAHIIRCSDCSGSISTSVIAQVRYITEYGERRDYRDGKGSSGTSGKTWLQGIKKREWGEQWVILSLEIVWESFGVTFDGLSLCGSYLGQGNLTKAVTRGVRSWRSFLGVGLF